MNQEASIDAWIDLGAPAEKLVLGLAMYGRTFTLKTKKQNGINAPATDAGASGNKIIQILSIQRLTKTI